MKIGVMISIKCPKCKEVKSEDKYDYHKYMGIQKRCVYCHKCNEIGRAKALEMRREKHGNGTICPSCKELKFDFEYRIINVKIPRFSTKCIECLIKDYVKKAVEQRRRRMGFSYARP